MGKTISAKMEITGAKECQEAIKGYDSSLSVLKSQMALTTSEFQNQQNSMEAISAKLGILNEQYELQSEKVEKMREMQENARAAQELSGQKVEEYKEKLKEAAESLDKLKASTEDTSEEQKKLTEEIGKLEGGLESAQRGQEYAAAAATKWEKNTNYAQTALNNLSAEIEKTNGYLEEAQKSHDGFATSMDKVGESTDKNQTQMIDLNTLLAEGFISQGLDKISEMAMKAAEAMITLANDYGEANSVIVKATGATNEALDSLSESMIAVYRTVDDPSLSNTAAAIGEINTRLDLTGSDLEKAGAQFMMFADNANTEVVSAVRNVSNITKNWNIDATETGRVLDMLTVAGQNSGASVDSLAQMMVTNKATLQELDFSLEKTVGLLGMMEKEGFNSSSVMMGLRTAVNKFSADGKAAGPAFQEVVDRIKNMGSTTEATALAVETFGSRAGQELAGAIRGGRFEVDKWTDAMKNSAGALAKTDKAADTLEDKWNNAMNNMKADLAGYSDELYKLGLDVMPVVQDALQWIADNAPVVASGVAGITAAVIAYKVAVGVATIANEAFKLSLNATGIGLVATAIAGLIAGISALALTWPESTSAAEEATEAAEKSAERLQEVADKTQSGAEAAEIAAGVSLKYAQRLKELEKAGLNTASAQQEYADTVSKLSELMPELNLEIDEQTGLLRDNGKALEDSIEAIKEQAKAKVYMEQYTAAVEENAKAEMALDDFRRESGPEQVAQVDALIEARKREKELFESLEGGGSNYTGEDEAKMRDELTQVREVINGATHETRDLEAAQATLSETVGKTGEAVGGAYEAYDAYNQKVAESAEAGAAANDFFTGTDEAINKAKESILALETEFAAAQQSIAGNLEGLFGTFNKIEVGSAGSAEDLIAALDSQLAYMSEYDANLKTVTGNMEKALAGTGEAVSQELIAKLSDGTLESAELLKTLSGASEESLSEINKKFGSVQEGTGTFATEMAKSATNFNTRMGEIDKRLAETVEKMNQQEQAAINAGHTVTGLVNGLRARMDEVYEAGKALGEKATQGYKDGNEIKSPSRAMYRAAGYTVDGVLVRLKEGEEQLRRANVQLAKAGISGYKDAMDIDKISAARISPIQSMDYQAIHAKTMASYYKGIETVRQAQTNNYDNRKDSYSYGNTYVIDGVTYDDGSNIATAVKSLVRAARMNRRM